MKYFLLFVFLSGCFLFNSCKKYKAAPAAFFIKPSLVSVAPTGTMQGSASHKITDLYLYVNGKFQGAYPVGNIMPIVSDGKNVTIDILAGIKNNGILSTSIPWAFYEKIHFDTLVENGKTIERPFTFKYNANTNFVWLENFDNTVGYSLIRAAYPRHSDTMYKAVTSSEAFDGTSIQIGLKPGTNTVAQFESSIYYNLPIGNTNVYLEINYKGDQEFEVGVINDNGDLKSTIIVNPKSEWNKIYIQLADAISRSPVSQTGKYKIYFKMLPNASNDTHVWLDNIKLIYL